MMSTSAHDPDALGAKVLSVALIGPRSSAAKRWPARLLVRRQRDPRVLLLSRSWTTCRSCWNPGYDVIIVDLDSDPEHALDLVENICGNSSVTVMVYSASTDSELLVRCMRAGAREFLTQPIAPSTIAEALVRASVRRPAVRAGEEGRRQVTGICWAPRAAPASPPSPATLPCRLPRNPAKAPC